MLDSLGSLVPIHDGGSLVGNHLLLPTHAHHQGHILLQFLTLLELPRMTVVEEVVYAVCVYSYVTLTIHIQNNIINYESNCRFNSSYRN